MLYFLLFWAFFVICRPLFGCQRCFIFDHELGSGVDDP
jgi:hypothetical protein